MANNPYIICENLVKIYQVEELEIVALQGLDIAIDRGEMLGVIGPSGSGKSTLMNILGGLDRPSAGRVRVGDQDLLKASKATLNKYRRTQIGFVWQQSARNLVPYLNAYENVLLPMTLAGVHERQKRIWGNELLEMVGLSDRRRHRLSQMSGGEQQRVAIAVSLANRPGLLLADEPTGEVDEDTALKIYDTFRELNRQLGITILIVSHDPGIARHVDRVVAIRDGKLATEILRRSEVDAGENTDQQGKNEAETEYEELVVLDSAGRLQLPKEYLDHLAINKRVRLELQEGGIMIWPVAKSSDGQPPPTTNDYFSSSHPPNRKDEPSTIVQKFLGRLRAFRSKNSNDEPLTESDSSQEKKL